MVRAGASPRIAHNLFARNATSERAPGTMLIEADARPELTANTFQGVRPESIIVPARPDGVPRLSATTGSSAPSPRVRQPRVHAAEGRDDDGLPARRSVRDRPARSDAAAWRPSSSPRTRATRRKVALKLVSDDRRPRGAGDPRRGAVGRAAAGAARRGVRRSCRACTRTGSIRRTTSSRWSTSTGENLSDVIAAARSRRQRRAAIACELCRFLEAAHRFDTTIDGVAISSRSCTAI